VVDTGAIASALRKLPAFQASAGILIPHTTILIETRITLKKATTQLANSRLKAYE